MVDGHGGPGGHGQALSPLRLLVVEPDPRAALLIGEMARAGWPGPLVVAHAERLLDADRELVAGVVDCLLLDAGQLAGDGLAALEHVRDVAAHVPFVVLGDAGHDAGEQSEIDALRAGAQAFLVKDELHPRALRRAVRQAIERKEAEAELIHRSLHDSLTGLPNRALFLDRLRVALDRARRSGARVAVLFLDVDDFKEINDNRGHAAGDALLCELADRLRIMLRPMDTVARFGGDEFTFLFEDLGDDDEVVLIAERITRACRVPVAVAGAELGVTVSMGIAMATDPAASEATIIGEADAAMYRAKERGGGRYEIFDEMTRVRANERVELQRALGRAIDERRLRLLYQPEFSVGDARELVRLEALLRWDHPERGLLRAEEFMPLAEECGLVLQIGPYVIRQALHALAAWRSHRPDLTVSINLSPRELEDLGLVSGLASALRAADFEPGALVVEISERGLVSNPARTRRVLQSLRDLGVETAIDDFGTGGSSLLGLRTMPVDTVKLHGSLLRDGGADGHGEHALLGAVVGLAHALGLQVTAKGVETEEQAHAAHAAGCDRTQGYLFAAPMSEENVSALLAGESVGVG